jgi:methyl-accepting chemotaxis protein
VLVDETRDVVKAYGVWHRIGLDAWNTARPALFLIAPDRRIHFSFVGDSQGEFPGHEEILGEIDRLRTHGSRTADSSRPGSPPRAGAAPG